MRQEQPRYLSYLLRIWQVKAKGGPQWRASLESPGNGEKRTFSSLELLIAFLQAQTAQQELVDTEENNERRTCRET